MMSKTTNRMSIGVHSRRLSGLPMGVKGIIFVVIFVSGLVLVDQLLTAPTITATRVSMVTSISAGGAHTCALADGQAYCWGDNTNGQLGNNSTTQSLVPVAVNTSGVLAGKTVTSISTDYSHTCALADGQAYCWGDNTYGQLGNNSTTQSLVPVAVNTSGVLAGKTVTSISTSTGTFYTCALADGQAYCWGVNINGQLGNNSTAQSLVPVAVNTSGVLAGKTVTGISAGGSHTCALADGQAYCWGDNTYGQLGNNSTTQSIVPVAVDDGDLLDTEIVELNQIGFRFFKNSNSLTPGQPLADINAPAQLEGVDRNFRLRVGVARMTVVTSISAGTSHTCALADGQAYCWGVNTNGRLGNNSTTQMFIPTSVSIFSELAPSGFLGDQVRLRVEFTELTASKCNLQTTGFVPITSSTDIALATNTNVSNGSIITGIGRDPFDSAITSLQTYRSEVGAFMPASDVPVGKVALFDISLRDNGASPDTTYCLRLAGEDGSVFSVRQAVPAVRTAKRELSVSVVDASDEVVTNPSFNLNSTVMKSTCQTTTGYLGVSNQQIRVHNTTSSGSWSLTLAATDGATAYWKRAGGGVGYDYNDPSGSPPGCNSGSDGDSLAGQLSVDPTAGTVTTRTGCSLTGISKGGATAFSQGVFDSISLLQAGSGSNTDCLFDLTGVGLSQKVPSYQQYGNYSLDVTLTVVSL